MTSLLTEPLSHTECSPGDNMVYFAKMLHAAFPKNNSLRLFSLVF